jgi:hypothetical protein
MTKLTRDQKEELEYFKSFAGLEFKYFPYLSVTLAIMPDGEASNFIRVSAAYASKSELKFRKKVGAYHAANRILGDEFILVRKCTNFTDLAYILGR